MFSNDGRCIILAENQNGWRLLEHLDIDEGEIDKYKNITGAFAILKIKNKYVLGYNKWRKQWEFRRGILKEEKPQDVRQKENYLRKLIKETII